MIRVGLTGGIGAGKSMVSSVFSHMQIPVFSADESGANLSSDNQDVVQAIKDLFGQDVYDGQGQLKTQLVAQQVFNDADLLQKLNDIIHPAVGRAFEEWASRQQGVYLIKEAAILFESGAYKQMDKVITVSAPEDIRLARVITRDGVNEEGVRQRMDNQWDEARRIENADFIIINDGKQLVIPQILKIHEDINRLAG